MGDLPSLPPGVVGLIAAAGSLAFLAWIAAAVLLARRRDWREIGWMAVTLAFAGATMAMSKRPGWHELASLTTLACALRSAVCLDGATRALTALGALAWIVAGAVAILVFR